MPFSLTLKLLKSSMDIVSIELESIRVLSDGIFELNKAAQVRARECFKTDRSSYEISA